MPNWFTKYFSERKAPVALFGLGLIAHLLAFYALMIFYGPCAFFLSNDCSVNGNDTQHYVIIADNLSHGNGYSRFVDPPYEPDALRTPLLPLYFAPFAYFGGLEIIWLAMIFLNILLSLLGPVLYKLARLFLPHSFALIAGIVFSVEPLYLYRSQIAEPDALLVLFLVTAAYFLIRSWQENSLRYLALCALVLGLSVLAKPTALYLAAVFVFFEIIHLAFFSGTDRRGRIIRTVAMVGIILLLVFPWLARNKIVFGIAELSSIQGFNLYEFYTKDLSIEGDQVPPMMHYFSREPTRYLPFQKDFVRVSIERIKQHPQEFAKQYAVGVLRNLFVSDIAAIYYYGHTKILPFEYNPESATSIHAALSRGGFPEASSAALKEFPKIIWALVLFVTYGFALAGCFFAWTRDRAAFLAFALFLVLFAYLLLASGPYVEAKYRLPALPLVFVVALYGVWSAIIKLQDTRNKIQTISNTQ
jgi:4-amino-4-deoxy-L-arabinose transferase-like glycosyltransferase